MGDPAVQFEKVSKRFRRDYSADSLRDSLLAPLRGLFGRNGNGSDPGEKTFWALRDVDFQVHQGEALGIIGPNGSGKSTALKLLSRILRPDAGRIRVRGRVGALIELGAGFNPDLTGRENVFLNASILGMTRSEIEKKYDQIVEFAELADFMDMPVKWYSSGMFARLGFSVAVHTEPQVLLVDEVLSVGDVGFQRRCFERMMEFKARTDTGIVFVSHNMNAVATLCDRVLLLDKGKVKTIGTPHTAISAYNDLMDTNRDCADSDGVTVEESLSLDQDGEPTQVFASGSPATICVRMRFQATLEHIVIAFVVTTDGEKTIFGTNTMRLGGKSLSVKAGDIVEVGLHTHLHLAPGTYRVRMSIFNFHRYRLLARRDILTVLVKEDPRVTGLANLNPMLRVFKKNGTVMMEESQNGLVGQDLVGNGKEWTAGSTEGRGSLG